MIAALARLLRRRRRYRELEGLHEISQAFAAMTDIRETYGRLTRRLAELIGAEKCAISLYDPVTREIVGQAPGYNVPDEYVRDARYPADVRLLTVFAAQAAVAIQNARLFTALERSAAELEAKVRARTAELEATNRELADSHARLRELDQLKSDFLGNVSHELRTPLASVKGFVDNLLDGVAGPLRPKQRHYLVRVGVNAERLTRMVSDLLDLTRIEAGKIELLPAALDVAETVGEATESLRPLARVRGVGVALAILPCPPIWGDPDKVHQIVTNLVSNAVKFTPVGGRVSVVAAPAPQDMVRIAVSDTGVGIPPDERERVFDKFYQAGRVDGERPPGSGLGLTIARHLVELHGGQIWIEDGVGAGSTFVVLLPVARGGR